MDNEKISPEEKSKIEFIKRQAKEFLEEPAPGSESQRGATLRQIINFIVLAVKSFVRNRCLARASALAYTTLLGLVPLLAVAIGVTTSLLQKEGEKPIQEMLDKFVAYVAPALDLEVKKDGVEVAGKRKEVVEKITEFVSNIHSGALGATGVVALIFIAVSMLRTIESTFNDIWGVARGRNFVRAFVQYWAVITLGPIIFVLALGLTSSPYISHTRDFITALGTVGRIIIFLLPFAILSLAFALFYQLMPNTRVQWRSALVGGIVGGCLWQLNSMFNTLYINRVVTYSKIYGSLGILPVFLIGLYFSWLILLFGAQVAYAHQNRRAYLMEKLSESVNQFGREFVALRLMVQICRAFENGYGAQKLSSLTNALGIPSQLASRVLTQLVNEGLIIAIQNGETAYIPKKPLEKISLYDVVQAVRRANGREVETVNDAMRQVVRNYYDEIINAERQVGERITMKELATI
ncbi:MAG: YhjD/YihY/BrkB family envelope integrity protein [Verrucomicrobiia bacterium]|jgi:membrane protein